MKKTDKPIFRASEVLDMAVQIEEQGLKFYQRCRDFGPNDNRIREEEKHIQRLHELRRDLEHGR